MPINFNKYSISGSDVSNLVIDYEAIKKENSEFKQTLDKIDEESGKYSANIVSGDNILFCGLKSTERNMAVGIIGAISEIFECLYNPNETLLEFDSKIENQVIKNSILVVGALKTSFLMNRNSNFEKTSDIINWMTLEILNTSSDIAKKVEEKWPRPTKEDYEKEDFKKENWPKPNLKEIFSFIYQTEEFKKLYEKMKDNLHGYVNSLYHQLSNNIESSTWMLDIFKDMKEEDILNKIELIKNVEHQYINWVFDEKIKDAIIEVFKSTFNLFDILSISGVSLKKFLSSKE